jgi:histidinol-phosphatase (PHP family)
MREAWRVSMHGGHSGTYCDHARASLREVVEAASAAGLSSFGVSEHAPRMEARYLYEEERRRGWTVETTRALFEAYLVEAVRLQAEFAGRLDVWVGFEAEVVPEESWWEWAQEWRGRPGVQFVVGSVHFVGGSSVDGPVEELAGLVERMGSIEAVAVEYYRGVGEMVRRLRPDIVGHLDLIRKNGRWLGDVETARVRDEVSGLLEEMASMGEDAPSLDLNVAGWRKGLPAPYPAPWVVRRANELGLAFTLGDDSHGPDDVGVGLDRGRAYLLSQGVRSVRVPVGSGDDGTLRWENVGLM